jgi:sortase A
MESTPRPAVRSPIRRPSLVWLERTLILVGVLCLGVYGFAWLDARLFQYREGRILDEALAHRAERKAPSAAETDSLESFRRHAAERNAAASLQSKEEGPSSLALPFVDSGGAEVADEGQLVGRIEVPRVGVSTLVLEGVGGKTLRRGAGHIPETAFPIDMAGNVGIAGHRDTVFRGLKDIRKGDVVRVTTIDGMFRYKVDWTRIVTPKDTEVLAPSEQPVLTLVTCYPFYYVGSAPKRFIVRAHRIDDDPAESGSGDGR